MKFLLKITLLTVSIIMVYGDQVNVTANVISSDNEFMIFYSNDVRGEIEPCG